MSVARSYLGVKEFPGAPSNPIIMQWAKNIFKWIGIDYHGDHIPWCGLFVAAVMEECDITPPHIAVRASEWSKWGQALEAPCYGAIMVFTRPGGGHVGFYVSEDAECYHILGGNQSDSVNLTRIKKDRLGSIRWAPDYPIPNTKPIFQDWDSAISENES